MDISNIDINKMKIRLGIASQDDSFNPEIELYIQDGINDLGVHVGAKLEPSHLLLPTVEPFLNLYVVRAFRGESMTSTGLADYNDRLATALANFGVDWYNANK